MHETLFRLVVENGPEIFRNDFRGVKNLRCRNIFVTGYYSSAVDNDNKNNPKSLFLTVLYSKMSVSIIEVTDLKSTD